MAMLVVGGGWWVYATDPIAGRTQLGFLVMGAALLMRGGIGMQKSLKFVGEGRFDDKERPPSASGWILVPRRVFC